MRHLALFPVILRDDNYDGNRAFDVVVGLGLTDGGNRAAFHTERRSVAAGEVVAAILTEDSSPFSRVALYRVEDGRLNEIDDGLEEGDEVMFVCSPLDNMFAAGGVFNVTRDGYIQNPATGIVLALYPVLSAEQWTAFAAAHARLVLVEDAVRGLVTALAASDATPADTPIPTPTDLPIGSPAGEPVPVDVPPAPEFPPPTIPSAPPVIEDHPVVNGVEVPDAAPSEEAPPVIPLPATDPVAEPVTEPEQPAVVEDPVAEPMTEAPVVVEESSDPVVLPEPDGTPVASDFDPQAPADAQDGPATTVTDAPLEAGIGEDDFGNSNVDAPTALDIPTATTAVAQDGPATTATPATPPSTGSDEPAGETVPTTTSDAPEVLNGPAVRVDPSDPDAPTVIGNTNTAPSDDVVPTIPASTAGEPSSSTSAEEPVSDDEPPATVQD